MDTPQNSSAPPALAELFAHYLKSQVSANQAGHSFAGASGEVLPYEAVPAQLIDPRLAWNEALAVVPYVHPQATTITWEIPSDWTSLVAAHEPVLALPFCLGNFPQLVRDLQPLLRPIDPGTLRVSAPRPTVAPAVVEWASQAACTGQPAQLLMAVAMLRLANQFDHAVELLRQHQFEAPEDWRLARANEEAALAWHRGRTEEARALWLVQAPSVPILFNRGLAALFLNRPAEARSLLQQAADQLPEQTGWHHLARLYLALAESR
jgi:hypothetical protein